MTNPSALNAANNPRGGRFWLILGLIFAVVIIAAAYGWQLFGYSSKKAEWKPASMGTAAHMAYADRKLAMRNCDFRHPGSVQKLQGNILRERPFFEQAAKPADDEYAYKRCYYKAQALQQLDNLGFTATVARASTTTVVASTATNDVTADTVTVPSSNEPPATPASASSAKTRKTKRVECREPLLKCFPDMREMSKKERDELWAKAQRKAR